MRCNLIIGGLPAVFLRLTFVTWLSAERTVYANHLSCVCSLAECENVSELDCPNGAGTVWDSCRCCRICARVESEPCGGPYGFSGSCAEGLECVVTDLFKKNGVGVCTRILNKEMSCESPKVISGCNIVDFTCRCEHSQSCAEESPFNFLTRQECEMNLEAMLAQKDQSTDDEVDEERFEHLKDMYYKQCQPINMNLIRKLTEKRTTSNYNYYDSAQCSRVLGSGIGGSSTSSTSNVSSMVQRSHRDIAVRHRDNKSSNSSSVEKTHSRDHTCANCRGRRY